MIEKNFNERLVNQEPSSKALIKLLQDIDGRLNFKMASVYHNFPVYPNGDGTTVVSANIIFVSIDHGIFIFQCIENSSRSAHDYLNTASTLNDIDRLLFAKILKDAPNLQRDRRSLKIDITPAIFFDNCDSVPNIPELEQFNRICGEAHLQSFILGGVSQLSEQDYRELLSTIEGSKGVPKLLDRRLTDPKDFTNSKGAILSAVESEIHNFDLEQKRAALFILDGPQRIRGLAGSGKTIILAMKAALIHLQFPHADILYTYYTKALHDLVKRLITRFYRQFAERDPNWDKIHIIHAWGGRHLNGVYSDACDLNNLPKLTLVEARKQAPKDPFGHICNQLIQYTLKKQYDYALLDEAQDFPPSFYRLCRQITRGNKIIWAYDDFQNILHIDMQSEKETFGKDEVGEWHIDFSTKDDQLQDIILHKCYRNPRKILIFAFALGLGIYNKDKKGNPQIVQRLESNEHWQSLGFEIEQGDSSDGCHMVVARPESNNMAIKNSLLNSGILSIKGFDTFEEEVKFITDSILLDLEKELKPEDISVVCMDNVAVRNYFELIERRLAGKGVKTFNMLSAPPDNTLFKVKNHVTLSTVFTAKGNEAGSIYITGIDSVFARRDDITERNKIFTAMTRSLGWVTLSGVGENVHYCSDELRILKENDFKLIFDQPSEHFVRTIRQGIDRRQALLNKIERMADELSGESDLSTDEIVDQLKSKLLFRKK